MAEEKGIHEKPSEYTQHGPNTGRSGHSSNLNQVQGYYMLTLAHLLVDAGLEEGGQGSVH